MRGQAITGTDTRYAKSRSAGISRKLVACLVVIVSFAAFVPFSPCFPINTLDSGWAFALNVATAKGLIFGKDVIFTFGPYASIYSGQYFPGTDTQSIWGGSLLAVAFASSLIMLYDRIQRLWAAGLGTFLVFIPRDTLLFTIPLMALLLVSRFALPAADARRVEPTLPIAFTFALLVMSLSLLPLIKGTFAIASGLVMVLSCGLLFARGYLGFAVGGALLFGLAMPVLWVISGQHILDLPNFFLAQRPIISGYTAAMSVRGSRLQIASFLLGCLFIGLPNVWRLNSSDFADRVFYAGTAILLFLAFKEGFVRDDSIHSIDAAGMLGVVGWVVFLDRRGLLPTLSLVVGMLVWLVGDYNAHGVMTDLAHHRHIESAVVSLSDEIASPFVSAGEGVLTRLTDPEALKHSYADSLTAIQAQQPLPKLIGSTDIYSYGQSALLAAGLQWAPRPVLQSYSAYTPSLALLDANYLGSSKAPENILFAVQPIDGRLPALEDGTSWLEMLGDYNFVGLSGDLAILKRRNEPTRPISVTDLPVISGPFTLGKPVALPGNVPAVWARIDIRPTLLGSLLAVLFKPPQIKIIYFFPDGSQKSFRYIAGMGATGFVAAPLVQSTADFVALGRPDFSNYCARRQPTSFLIDAGRTGRWLWKSPFSVRLFAMHPAVQPAAG